MATITKTGFVLNLKGKSGTIYVFTLYNGIPELGKAGGLYIFTKADTNGNHTRIYLGRTGDLSVRFDDHHKAECIKKNGATHFGVCLMSEEKERVNAEADLLAALNFTCNEVMN
ncbi:MAG TPA: hypothetical protein VHD35_02725 [Chitinophagaceae bacterium]|nr:hypothetical protein [Chitinophagaceae bacterium]